MCSGEEQLANGLWEAIYHNDIDKVRSLLKQGADPNHQLYWTSDWCIKKLRYPPIHTACRNGYLEITMLFLDGGAADVEKCDSKEGMTPFHFACLGGNIDIVVYLHQHVKCRTGMYI